MTMTMTAFLLSVARFRHSVFRWRWRYCNASPKKMTRHDDLVVTVNDAAPCLVAIVYEIWLLGLLQHDPEVICDIITTNNFASYTSGQPKLERASNGNFFFFFWTGLEWQLWGSNRVCRMWSRWHTNVQMPHPGPSWSESLFLGF